MSFVPCTLFTETMKYWLRTLDFCECLASLVNHLGMPCFCQSHTSTEHRFFFFFFFLLSGSIKPRWIKFLWSLGPTWSPRQMGSKVQAPGGVEGVRGAKPLEAPRFQNTFKDQNQHFEAHYFFSQVFLFYYSSILFCHQWFFFWKRHLCGFKALHKNKFHAISDKHHLLPLTTTDWSLLSIFVSV